MEEHARRAYSTREEYAKLKAYRDQLRQEKQARIEGAPRNQENHSYPDYDYEEPYENVFAPPNAARNASTNVRPKAADEGRRKQTKKRNP